MALSGKGGGSKEPPPILLHAFIQRSAWKGRSANFAFTEFSEDYALSSGNDGSATLRLKDGVRVALRIRTPVK